jgi:hypothetical protein
MKRSAVLLVVLLLTLSLTARADEASRRAKAQEMVTLLHMDTLMKQMMDNVHQQAAAAAQQRASKSMTPQEKAKLDDFQNRMFALIESQMGWKSLEPDILDLYAKTFTDEDLDGMLAFYKSPAGISMVQKLPGLMTQAMQLTQSRIVALQPQLKQMISDFSSETAPKESQPAKP